MADLSLPAPGKLNLFLRILGRRADGYHELQTLYQFVDLGERLEFRPGGTALTLEGFDIAPEDNLVWRAARLLGQRADRLDGVHIQIHKTIPAGSGLGGGSSDAATTLLGLNRLWGLRMSLDELATLGLELGADVPLFVHGRAALGEGIGERLTPQSPPEIWYLLLLTDVAVSTAAVFQHPDLKRNSAPLPRGRPLTDVVGNDCEALVFSLYPELAEAHDWLSEHAAPRLSGTGGCLFASFDDSDHARQVAARAPTRWRTRVVRASNASPLHRALNQLPDGR